MQLATGGAGAPCLSVAARVLEVFDQAELQVAGIPDDGWASRSWLQPWGRRRLVSWLVWACVQVGGPAVSRAALIGLLYEHGTRLVIGFVMTVQLAAFALLLPLLRQRSSTRKSSVA